MKKSSYKKNLKSRNKSGSFVPAYPNLQKKLIIDSSYDKYEAEADRVADQIVSKSTAEVADKPQTGPIIQKKCSACDEEKHLQKKPLSEQITPLVQRKTTGTAVGSVASSDVNSKIDQSKGGGRPMGKDTRNTMESGFGTDFSNVRIHTDTNAKQLSNELNAQAFTVGNDIYFNEGKYNPYSNSGKHLLAHELTHTVQQGATLNRKIQKQGEECTEDDEYGVCYPEEELDSNNLEEQQYNDDSSGGFCESPKEVPVAVGENDVCYLPDHPITQQSFIGSEVDWNAKVKAKWGIRLHTTPIESDYDYVNRTANSRRAYKRGTSVTVIAEGNKNHKGWVKLKTKSGAQGWIQKKFLVPFPKSPTFDLLSKSLYYVEKGDNLENLIKEKGWYSDYSFSTGNDYRSVVHAFSIMNAENRAIYYRGKYDRSWWKDSVFDRSMEETRKIYQTIRLRQGYFIRMPSKNYIKMLQDKDLIGTRAAWKNDTIEFARSVQGFIEGVVVGIGEAAYDTIKGLVELIIGIFTGEIFKQAYELATELWKMGLSGVWEMIKGFFSGVKQKFIDNWNNTNPRQKWYFFGKIVGMILFEIILAIITGGIGNVIAKSSKIGKVLSKFKSLKKIINNKRPELDKSLSKKDIDSVDDIYEKRKSVPDESSDFDNQTREKVQDEELTTSVKPKPVKSLSRGAQQAKDLKWPDPPGPGYFWVFRKNGKPYLSRTSKVDPKYYDEASGTFKDGNRPIASTAHLPDISGTYKFEINTLFNGITEKIATGKLGVPGEVRKHRSKSAQKKVSSGTGDDAGHLIGDRFGAPGGQENLSRQNRWANQGGGTYHDLENKWDDMLQNGWEIDVTVREYTAKNSKRPYTRKVEWSGKGPNGELVSVKNVEYVNFETKMTREADGYIPKDKDGELIYLDDYRK